MLFSVKKWMKRQTHTHFTLCVWRVLRSATGPLCFILFLGCISIQTFVFHHVMKDKLSTLQPLSYTGQRQKDVISFPLNIWRGLLTEANTSAKLQQQMGEEGYGEPSDERAKDRHLSGISTTSRPRVRANECQPKSHIVFLKTHKTASSTIMNILYRYGESKNLTFALPRRQQSQFFYPTFFNYKYVEGFSKSGNNFHIISSHMRFKKAEVEKVMPADSFYFSILRHPVPMMESIFNYYKHLTVFKKFPTLLHFLDYSLRNHTLTVKSNYGHNLLTFDFGFDNTLTEASSGVDKEAQTAIAAIEKDFHLILISEYFDESVILLRHELCWSMEDVLSFKLNTRAKTTPVSPSTAEKIKRWNALDWRIYVHFNATFWKKVDSVVGRERMEEELAELRQLQALLTDVCLQEGGAVLPSEVQDRSFRPYQSGGAVVQGYNINPDLDKTVRAGCEKLITPELQYTAHIYRKQYVEGPKSINNQKTDTKDKQMLMERAKADGKKLQRSKPKDLTRVAGVTQNKYHVKTEG